MDVNLASHTHQVPQVGFHQSDPVTIDIKAKIHPIGTMLFASNGINLILKTKLQIEAILINPKQPKEIKEEGT